MKIGILSDTHGTLYPEFEQALNQCDYIIHAGDIGTEKCYEKLKQWKDHLYMIRGNCDHGKWAAYLPEMLTFHINNLRFLLIHNLAHLPVRIEDTDIIVYGHTHTYANYQYRGIYYLNPGSAGGARGESASMLLMDVDGEQFSIRKIHK